MAQVSTKTLYFINGRSALPADVTRAARLPGKVEYRDVNRDTNAAAEDCDYVTAAGGVTIPAKYVAVPRTSPEKPVSLLIVPDAPTFDLSDVEHGDLRAVALYADGTMADVTGSCVWGSATPGTGTVGAATGIFTPVGVGTTVITATYNWAAPGETGVAYASRVLTATGLAIADETVIVGGKTYTWKATIDGSSAANAVKIGATAAACMENLKQAINLEKTGKGSLYASATTKNANVRATRSSAALTAIAINPGTSGNAIASTETGTNMSWAGATLTGGTDATASVADTTTVTVVA